MFRPPLTPPDSGGEFRARVSSPESGEVRRGLNKVRRGLNKVRRGLNKVRKRLNNGRFDSSDLPYPIALAIRGHLVMVILVIFDFGNAVICSLYINIIIFIYSVDYDIICFDFDK